MAVAGPGTSRVAWRSPCVEPLLSAGLVVQHAWGLLHFGYGSLVLLWSGMLCLPLHTLTAECVRPEHLSYYGNTGIPEQCSLLIAC